MDGRPNILLIVSDEERRNQDHEWYETGEDPHELANDRGRRSELRALFRRLLDYETEELTLTP